MTDNAQWAAICLGHEEIRRDAGAYGRVRQWRKLLDDTRSGTATLAEWSEFLDEIEELAEEERNFVSKGNALERRMAALGAASGDYVCASGRCDRSAPLERASRPPFCPLFERPMAPG